MTCSCWEEEKASDHLFRNNPERHFFFHFIVKISVLFLKRILSFHSAVYRLSFFCLLRGAWLEGLYVFFFFLFLEITLYFCQLYGMLIYVGRNVK